MAPWAPAVAVTVLVSMAKSAVDGHVAGHVQVGAAGRQDAVAPADEAVVLVGQGRDRAAVAAVVDGLRELAGEAAAGAGCVGEAVAVDGELRRDVEVGGDVHVGAACRGHVVAPLDEVVALIGDGRDRAAVAAVVDGLPGVAGEAAVGAGGVGEGVAVDGEAGRDRVRAGDVRERVAAPGDRVGVGDVVDQHVGDVVALVRGDGERLVAVVVDGHGARGVDGAVGAGGGGDRVGVDGELRRDVEVVRDRSVGAARRQDAVAPPDEVVVLVGHRDDRGAVRAVVDGLREVAGEATVGAGGVGQGVAVDGEADRDRVRAGDVRERVAARGDRAGVGGVVDQHVGDVVAEVGVDR